MHILATSGTASPSVVRLHIEGLMGQQVAALLAEVAAVAGVMIEAGAVVSVTAHRIRVRLVPIGR